MKDRKSSKNQKSKPIRSVPAVGHAPATDSKKLKKKKIEQSTEKVLGSRIAKTKKEKFKKKDTNKKLIKTKLIGRKLRKLTGKDEEMNEDEDTVLHQDQRNRTLSSSSLFSEEDTIFDVPEFKNYSDSDPEDDSVPEIIISDEPETSDNEEDISMDETQTTISISSNKSNPSQSRTSRLQFTGFTDEVRHQKLNDHSILVSISPNTTLPFMGKAKIKVLKGAVEICGHVLDCNSPMYEVYSPQLVLPNLFCIHGKETSARHPQAKNSNTKRSSHLSSIQSLIGEELLNFLENVNDTVLIMEGFENHWSLGLRHLLHVDASDLIGHKMISDSDHGGGEENFIEKLGFLFRPPSELESAVLDVSFTLSKWVEIFDDIFESKGRLSRVGVFGGQNSGKSTLLRWLSNRFLNYSPFVLYIDLDPGQPEFTPAGMISVTKCEHPILGPNYTQSSEPLLSVFLGSTNMADNPLSYWKAVQRLFNFLNRDESFRNVPWLINTMGFVKGLGADLACQIIKHFQLDAVIQFVLNRDKHDFSFELIPSLVSNHKSSWIPNEQVILKQNGAVNASKLDYNYFKLNSMYYMEDEDVQIENQFGLSFGGLDSKRKRDNAFLSYFARTMTANNTCSLESVVPYVVSLESLKIGITSSENHCLTTSDAVLRTMNGNLIALCHSESDSGNSEVGDHSSGLNALSIFEYKKSDDILCYGYGFVRAIDTQRQTLFIITPISSVILLEKVNCVVPAGAIGIPQQFYSNVSQFKRNRDITVPYVMNVDKHRINSRLHSVTKKFFVPNRVAAHKVLRKCLL